MKQILLLLACLSLNAHALEPSIEIVEQFDKLRLVAFIQQSDLATAPQWSPEQNPTPPFTIGEAIQQLKQQQQAQPSPLTLESVQEIELRPIPRQEGQWHYLLKTRVRVDGESRLQVYVVLLNGIIIPAIIEPETYK